MLCPSGRESSNQESTSGPPGIERIGFLLIASSQKIRKCLFEITRKVFIAWIKQVVS